MRALALAAIGLAGCAVERAPAASRQALDAADAPPASLTWVDFTVSGCSLTDGPPVCRGTAPLTLRFGAMAPRAIETYRWSFGDGAETSEASPAHRFAQPGSYTIALAAAAGGSTAQAHKVGFVVAAAARLGASCDELGQCDTGLTCTCAGGCPGVPGVCSRSCTGACGAGAACVGFAPGDADWQRPLCSPTCAQDADCAPGRRCRELSLTGGGWANVCWGSGFPIDEGGSCAAGSGNPDDARCAGGGCASLGARSLCAARCDASHPCPSYAACATFGNGDRRCLAACSAARPCTGDPFLACQTPGGPGALGFSAAGASLCAPRRCTQASECGPDGVCEDQGGASFCVPAR